MGGIFAFQTWGLLYGVAYTRRGLFSEFYRSYEGLFIFLFVLEQDSHRRKSKR